MKKGLLMFLTMTCVYYGYSQFSPKEQAVFNRFTSPGWLEVVKNTKGNATSFTQNMLDYAKRNRPLAKMPNNGYSKEDSIVFFQNSQLWLAYNPYLLPFISYSLETTKENPETDLDVYLTSLEVWKTNNKEKWNSIVEAIKKEPNGSFPELVVTKDKQESFSQYKEKLFQWCNQNPWYAEVLMKAHLEQIKRQLGL